ncbi:hypothetical protein ACFSE0_11265 [Ochrobactrum teleogrylli]|uniref:Ig-like domain-containing protein n=1 Tax=Ochrobactrum teleogrylli TaxID=2479765 RepID=A0ABY2XZL0_9HYPH|nr:hypothetical protein [[Ochrobactrum] teleogrylli]TNV09325.1 hypothetical protein FIC94_22050 [[Ochrobactrum] teleogrylli]
MKGEDMQYRQITIATILILNIITTAYASDKSRTITLPDPVQGIDEVPAVRTTSSAIPCGSGYVVGVWMGADGWNDWVVWLSQAGQNWSNADRKTYRAYSYAKLNQDPGKIYYAAIMQAMATGAKVQVMDDQYGFRCNETGVDDAKGSQFNSVQVWYP